MRMCVQYLLLVPLVFFACPLPALGERYYDDWYGRRDYRSGGYYDYEAEREREDLRRERWELDRERRELREERERLEDQRYYQPPAPRAQEQCPAGFHPGNHRCSAEDRKRGCKDMKMPGGTTCNAGPFS